MFRERCFICHRKLGLEFAGMDRADGKGEMLFCLECFDLAFPEVRQEMGDHCPVCALEASARFN